MKGGEGSPFGKYFLLKRIATGGMGEIFLAKLKGPEGFEKLLVVIWFSSKNECGYSISITIILSLICGYIYMDLKSNIENTD